MPDGLRLHVNPTGPVLAAAHTCEEAVFLQAFGNTRDELALEYGPYENQSVFLCVTDRDGDAVGAVRILVHGPAGLKTLNDIANDPWRADPDTVAAQANIDPVTTWDIATLGVRATHRGDGMLVGTALYYGIAQLALLNPVTALVAILDDNVNRLFAAIGWHLNPLPGTHSASYLGSPASTPVYGHTDVLRDHQRTEHPDTWTTITHGTGLNGVTLPAPDDFILPRSMVHTR